MTCPFADVTLVAPNGDLLSPSQNWTGDNEEWVVI
jgi:hypothetical protein